MWYDTRRSGCRSLAAGVPFARVAGARWAFVESASLALLAFRRLLAVRSEQLEPLGSTVPYFVKKKADAKKDY